MKKTWFTALLLVGCLIGQTAYGQPTKRKHYGATSYSPLFDDALSGNVEQVICYYYNVKMENGTLIKEGSPQKDVYLFNSNGDVIKHNSPYSTTYYTYHENSRNDAKIERYRENGVVEIELFNEDGFPISETHHRDGVLLEKLTYQYESDWWGLGAVSEGRSYRTDGSLANKIRYNKQGKEIERVLYDENGQEEMRQIFEYDSNDKLIVESVLRGEREESFHMNYNTIGKQSKVERYENGKLSSVRIFIYSSEGKVIEERQESSDLYNYRRIHRYDYNGRVIETEEFGENKRPQDMTHEKTIATYDVYGNMKTRLMIRRGSYGSLWEYEIIYRR